MNTLFDELKFDTNGLLPVIVQDVTSSEVLMMAYMNKEALQKSIETGMAHYWSRSRGRLWLKGETSGHCQYIKSMSLDCDGDTLLIKVEQKGAACHTGHYSCFYRSIEAGSVTEVPDRVFNPAAVYGDKSKVLEKVYGIIIERMKNPKEGSYTNYLFEKGLDKILKKVGEEAAEVIIASKNESKDEIIYETADLLYHLLVLLVDREVSPQDVYAELLRRHKPD
jgi:phosphoribosyl-ATP pyrophosphohydrolase/phosphoribosyl-AMP cyclohydrolase